MCGIFGYFGRNNALPIIFKGLKMLEYRGYDSTGIAILGSNLEIRKDVGRVDELFLKINSEGLAGNIGIGHTRWATHGKVSKENAHPHLSNNKKIAVVHNGIIENYQEFKDFLKKEGFVFYSETDTEVIPNLIEYEMRKGKNFEEACKDAFKNIEGNYAILAIHEDEKKIIAARNGSPLVIGVGNGEYFASSDIPAFLEFTQNVIYLHDKDFVVLSEEMKFYNIDEEREVKREVKSVEWKLEQVKKGNFEHYMLKEIFEQVETIQRSINQDEKILRRISRKIKEADRVFLIGCGTSYYACLTASYLFSKIAKRYVDAVLASEFLNYEGFLTEKTLVIAVSQSGETVDVLEAIKTAKKKRSKVISIVNVVGSSLHRNSDQALLMNAGPEICVLSTKTYTSQLAILTLLAYALAGKYEEGRNKLKYLWNLIYNLTSESMREHLKIIAERLKDKEHLFLIGRGLQYPTALEAALKIKEVSYIHAEAFAGGELKHGTIALIENGTPCIVFVSEENEKEIISNAYEIKARGGYIIGISSKRNEVFDFWIKVPEVGETNPICQIIPIQILAYQLAVLRGYDPDKPRNLAKAVCVK